MCSLAALLYNFTLHRKVATMENPSPVLSKVVASVSLLLWMSIVFGGIFHRFPGIRQGLERLSSVHIAHSIQSIPFLTEFSESVLAYPIVLSLHLTCIAFFGGMILMTNLRLLGLTFKSLTITQDGDQLPSLEARGRSHHDCRGRAAGNL